MIGKAAAVCTIALFAIILIVSLKQMEVVINVDTTARPQTAEGWNFKAMTFNLRTSTANDGEHSWPYRAQHAVETIRQHDPLVFGTQEAQYGMLEDLAAGLPEYRWLGFGRVGGHKGEHNAIFYKKELLLVVEQGQFWLSEQPDLPNSVSWDSSLPRICTWAHFRFREHPEREFIVFNTHLDHRGEVAREKGAQLIWTEIAKRIARQPLPFVLTGDFNAKPDSTPIRFLRGELPLDGQVAQLADVFVREGQHPGSTFHGYRGGAEGEPIDYIFASPQLEVVQVIVERQHFNGIYPSDHYPIVAELRVAP